MLPLEALAEKQQKTLPAMRPVQTGAFVERVAGGEGLPILGLVGYLRMHVAQHDAEDVVEERQALRSQQMSRLAQGPHDAIFWLVIKSEEERVGQIID